MHSPLGCFLQLPVRGATPEAALCCRCFSPVFTRQPPPGCKRGGSSVRGVFRPSSWGRVARILLSVFGSSQIPVGVWGMPEELIASVHAAVAAADFHPEHFPASASGSGSPGFEVAVPAVPAVYGAGSLSALDPLAVGTPVAILTPGFGTQILSVPLGGRHPVDAGQEIASHLDDAGKLLYARLIPTDPQLQPGALTFVQVPNWVDTSDQRVAVVDFSAFGEPTYAAFLPAVLSLSDLQAVADTT